MSESWWEYVQRVSAHAQGKDVARAAGTDPSTITSWKKGQRPGADNVVAFARAYSRPPQEALIVAGFLTPEDLAGTVHVHTSVTEVSDGELSEEIARRLTNYSAAVDDMEQEMRRRAATDDPRRIDPGSASDVFPRWSDGDDGEGTARFR